MERECYKSKHALEAMILLLLTAEQSKVSSTTDKDVKPPSRLEPYRSLPRDTKEKLPATQRVSQACMLALPSRNKLIMLRSKICLAIENSSRLDA